MTDTRIIGPYLVYRVRPPRERRIGQVVLGLVILGIALGLGVEAELGVGAWTVFHGGVANHTPLSIGQVTMLTGAVLLLVFPLIKQPVGLGTLLNVAIIGLVIDVTLFVVPDLTTMTSRLAALGAAPILAGLGSGLYIGAGLGPGPRDGLMTTLERLGVPVWIARSMIEISALVLGALLGGDVGWGTLWMAGSVGVAVDVSLRRNVIDAVT